MASADRNGQVCSTDDRWISEVHLDQEVVPAEETAYVTDGPGVWPPQTSRAVVPGERANPAYRSRRSFNSSTFSARAQEKFLTPSPDLVTRAAVPARVTLPLFSRRLTSATINHGDAGEIGRASCRERVFITV